MSVKATVSEVSPRTIMIPDNQLRAAIAITLPTSCDSSILESCESV
jgi:hypothetical protein